MLRKFIFKNNATGQEIVLPVTPAGFSIDRGVPVQTVELVDFGEIALPGSGMKLFTVPLAFLLPRQRYPFCQPSANLDPYFYVEFFQTASDNKQTLRFVVSGTPTICDVLVENLNYEEKDGTGDLYCTLTMHRYRAPGGAAHSGRTAPPPARTDAVPSAPQESYTVRQGDTLAAICRRFYGDETLTTGLARYNGIAQAALIFAGATLRLPSASQL